MVQVFLNNEFLAHLQELDLSEKDTLLISGGAGGTFTATVAHRTPVIQMTGKTATVEEAVYLTAEGVSVNSILPLGNETTAVAQPVVETVTETVAAAEFAPVTVDNTTFGSDPVETPETAEGSDGDAPTAHDKHLPIPNVTFDSDSFDTFAFNKELGTDFSFDEAINLVEDSDLDDKARFVIHRRLSIARPVYREIAEEVNRTGAWANQTFKRAVEQMTTLLEEDSDDA